MGTTTMTTGTMGTSKQWRMGTMASIIRNNNDIGDGKNSITNHKNEQQRQTQ